VLLSVVQHLYKMDEKAKTNYIDFLKHTHSISDSSSKKVKIVSSGMNSYCISNERRNQ